MTRVELFNEKSKN